MHIRVEAEGNPLKVEATAGTVADCTRALPLTENVEAGFLLADRGYDADSIIDGARARGMEPVLPPKSNRREKRPCDAVCLRLRHGVENTFLRCREWRGIATRYAKRLSSFLALLHPRCAFLWRGRTLRVHVHVPWQGGGGDS